MKAVANLKTKIRWSIQKTKENLPVYECLVGENVSANVVDSSGGDHISDKLLLMNVFDDEQTNVIRPVFNNFRAGSDATRVCHVITFIPSLNFIIAKHLLELHSGP